MKRIHSVFSALAGAFLVLPVAMAVSASAQTNDYPPGNYYPGGGETARNDGQCDLMGTPGTTPCSNLENSAITKTYNFPSAGNCAPGITAGCYNGVRSDRGNALTVPLDVYNKCRFVNNVSLSSKPVSYFIPMRTEIEWDAFNAHTPADLQLSHCVRRFSSPTLDIPTPDSATANIYPGIGCSGATTVNAPGYEPIAAGASFTRVVAPPPSFLCNGDKTTIGSRVSWKAFDAEARDHHSGVLLSPSPLTSWQPFIDYGPNLTLVADKAWVNSGSPVVLSWTTTVTPIKKDLQVGSNPNANYPAKLTGNAATTLNITGAGTDITTWSQDWASPAASANVTQSPTLSSATVSSPGATMTYVIKAKGANGIESTANTTVLVCPTDYSGAKGACYKATFDSCPSCGYSGGTLPAKSCVDAGGNTVVNGFCDNQTKSCPAVGACETFSWSWGPCVMYEDSYTGEQHRECYGSVSGLVAPEYCGSSQRDMLCVGGGMSCGWDHGSYYECDVGNTAGNHHIWGEFHCPKPLTCADENISDNCWRWDSDPTGSAGFVNGQVNASGCTYWSH